VFSFYHVIKKPSGANIRAEQKEQELLSKAPKLEAFKFKPLSATTAAEGSAVASTLSSSEQAEN